MFNSAVVYVQCYLSRYSSKQTELNDHINVDMKNIVPKECLTCLVAKATLDELMLWHRRLGYVNFKTINKIVKENLVRGLPTKRFENDQTCVAYLKRKQHKASYKSKIQNSITQPLFMLHMDLFGPTFVSSLINKKYCLVVTDDYSRFTWVFFLASKDETSGILKSFITKIENLVDKKAARTMLADPKLPTTFWAEAVNTACYVHNRVLVVKPHNKTPYELFRGRTLALSFIRPFGCNVTILNIIDYLAKFDGKSDEGFFVGYSIRIMDMKSAFLYVKIEEEVYVCQPLGFEDPEFPGRVYKVGQILVNTLKFPLLHSAKRIFRYFKGQPKLGLWYPKDSPFDLEAYTDSDYDSASLDKKSTTRVILDKQLKNDQNKEIYVTPSHTRRLGEGSEIPTAHLTQSTIISTIAIHKPQMTTTGGKQGKTLKPSGSIEPITDEAANEEHVPIHSNDPLLSSEDRLKLNELMEICTNLLQRVLDLENTKTIQAAIAKLKEREDASKQRRKIDNLYANAKVTLVNEAQERNDDKLMFDTRVFDEQEVEVEKVVSTAEFYYAVLHLQTVDELTLAQTLIEIKAAKPKAVTTAATRTKNSMIDAVTELAARLQAQEQEDVIWKKIQSFNTDKGCYMVPAVPNISGGHPAYQEPPLGRRYHFCPVVGKVETGIEPSVFEGKPVLDVRAAGCVRLLLVVEWSVASSAKRVVGDSSLEDTTVLGSFPPLSTPVTTTAGNAPGKSSYANVTGEPSAKKLNIRTLFTPRGNGIDVVVPMESIRAISERFGKYGLVSSMFSSSTRLFSFKFSSIDGLDAMLENGPWFIRNNPFILKKWRPDQNLLKEDVSTVPVWVKLHGVPITAFSEDGLSAIATKLGTPIMLDSYTSDMCMQSWGRSSYTRAMIELQADEELKDNIVVAMPKVTREGHYIRAGEKKTLKKPSQTSRGVLVGLKIGFKPQKEYRYVPQKPTASSSGTKRKVWNLLLSSTGATPIIDKIKKFGELLTSGQAILVDEAVDNDMARSMALERVGFGTQSLLEQWRDSYGNGDYDEDP
ncbi:putative ribonuclease H-like domain-containing protein [Tanacetum coccineum]|uniref:Ribonuclease H-like domain-containing protein n=1 Tax=Tanacetum coccineum TaxID=301880 RepID=A0ABQ5ARD3_9ASTR